MHDISLFLFKNWLPVGLSAIAFSLIGLLFAKCIWGRFSHRLYVAVEENMNLASQWSALVSSQRDLFKKLRSRWQDDRDAWELRLAESEEVIAKKDSRIEDLIGALASEGKVKVEDLAHDRDSEERISELEATVAEKESEIAELKATIKSLPPAMTFTNPVEAEPVEVTTSEADSEKMTELQNRIRDLEQDLIDTHDELHDVRSGYRQQVDLVESLEAKLIDGPDSGEELEAASKRISELEAKLADNGATSRRAAQLAAMVTHRSRELFHFRRSIADLKADNSRLAADLVDARISADQSERIAELTSELESISGELERVGAELATKNEELESAQRRVEALEPIERRHDLLKAELNDAFHEMYDVRTALNYRLDEIELLEGRLDELDEVEEERDALLAELAETRRELSEVRMAFDEKNEALERRQAEMEELEAIIEDRGAEVNDLSAEVRQKRDMVRELKNKLAEHEGELEGLNDEARKASAALASKVAFSEEQSRRIADLEILLGGHYDEMNAIRAEMDSEAKSAKYYASRAKQLEAELERRDSQDAETHRKITKTENALEEANQRISLLTEQLEQSDSSIAILEDDVRRLSQEKDKTLRQLEETTRRIEELENAASIREEKLREYEEKIRAQDETALERESRIGELEVELSEKSVSLDDQEAIAADQAEKLTEYEVTLQSRNETISEQENRIADLESELSEKTNSLEDREKLAAERAEKVQELEALLAQRDQELNEANHEVEARAAHVSEIEKEIAEKNERAEKLSIDLERLNSELDAALREKENSRAAIAELEESLQSSDAKSLTLSQQLEEKHAEIAKFESELSTVREHLTAREAAVAESERRIATLEDELERRQKEYLETNVVNNANAAEIARLTEEIKSQQGHLNRYAQQKEESLAELDRLRSKVEKRGTSIRELQSQISSIMMQRASRDNEISLLKDKLRAVEADLRKAEKVEPEAGETEPTMSLESAIKKSLADDSDNSGASLDELEESESHHEPAPALSEPVKATPSPQPVSGEADDMAVYFDESGDGLSDDALKKIDSCARSFRQSGKKMELTVIGFAGSEGSTNFIEALSARRADSVRQRLLQRGVPQSSINVQSAGRDRRFSDWKARRVEMILAPQAVAERVN